MSQVQLAESRLLNVFPRCASGLAAVPKVVPNNTSIHNKHLCGFCRLFVSHLYIKQQHASWTIYRVQSQQLALKGKGIFKMPTKDANIKELKPEQKEWVHLFIKDKDIVAILPTGFGERLIYQCALLVVKKKYSKSIVVNFDWLKDGPMVSK